MCRAGTMIERTVELEPQTPDGASWPEDCLYVRVRQKNGQLAWSSPIWLQH